MGTKESIGRVCVGIIMFRGCQESAGLDFIGEMWILVGEN